MHTTMQTLGRVAIIGGLALVALGNVFLFHGTDALPKERKAEIYALVYTIALVIPVLSVAGVVLHGPRQMRRAPPAARRKVAGGDRRADCRPRPERETAPNWWILGGSLVFVAVTLSVGLSELRFRQEAIFAASMGIILFLLWRLARELAPAARETLVATALIIFVYRAMPSTGPGSTGG